MQRRATKVEKSIRSASRSTVGCALSRAEPDVERHESGIYTKHRRQTMGETIPFVGLDSHAKSTAIGVAEPGRAAPRFVGTVGPKFSELSKAPAKLSELVSSSKRCCFATVVAMSAKHPGAPPTMATVTLVVDLQVDYFQHKRLKEQRPTVIANTNQLVAAARAVGSPIVTWRYMDGKLGRGFTNTELIELLRK
jgi:hypothetical protein